MFVGLLSLAAAGNAFAQEAKLGWTSINTPAGAAAAWATKPADAARKPQVVIVMRSAVPGTEPGTDMRVSQVYALEADCAAGKARPVSQATYGADFMQTAAPTVANEWAYFAQWGEIGAVVAYSCATPNRTIEYEADLKGVQQKLDAKIPKPKIPITAPVSGTFEYVGKSPLGYQPVQYWLDTASIKREGNIVKAWSLEVWENAWGLVPLNFPPITWRLREFECKDDNKTTERNIWFQQIGSDLKPAVMSVTELPNAKPGVVGDTNIVAMALRVCKNRPLLFSEKIEGDLKTFISKRFLGASAKLGSGIAQLQPPYPKPVKLGPRIVIKEKDGNWTYTGTFTRSGGEDSTFYNGVVQTDGIENPNKAMLVVRGIIDGMLVIDREGTPGGEMKIPMTDGKPSGKGIAYWSRNNDAYSWTLVEPATITLK